MKEYLVKSTNHTDEMRCIIVEVENENEMRSLVERYNKLYCWDNDLYELHSFVEILDINVRKLFESVNKKTMQEMEDESVRLYGH